MSASTVGGGSSPGPAMLLTEIKEKETTTEAINNFDFFITNTPNKVKNVELAPHSEPLCHRLGIYELLKN